MVHRVQGFEELYNLTSGLRGPAFVGFFGDFSEKSRSAEPEFLAFCSRHPELSVFMVDVGKVKDIHRRLDVTLVPTVIEIRDGAVVQKVVGVRTAGEYETQLLSRHQGPENNAQKPSHRVVIYTTPTCSWCARAKAYLRQHNIPFTEVDVSRDYAAAQRLVAKTGEMGVPQLDIDGRYVVGFDKARIDALLGLGQQGGNDRLYS